MKIDLDITPYVNWIRREATVQLFEVFNEMGLGCIGAEAEKRRPKILV